LFQLLLVQQQHLVVTCAGAQPNGRKPWKSRVEMVALVANFQHQHPMGAQVLVGTSEQGPNKVHAISTASQGQARFG
jgi:hypothetical protein